MENEQSECRVSEIPYVILICLQIEPITVARCFQNGENFVQFHIFCYLFRYKNISD